VKQGEAACPFCGAGVGEGSPIVGTPVAGRPRSRAALLFAGAAVAAACGGATTTGGGDPGPSPVPLYGAAVVDASDDRGAPSDAAPRDATEDAPDTGGPVALYGPAIIDGGNG
jgi:hypothetical protein